MRKLTRMRRQRPAPLHRGRLGPQLRNVDEYFNLPIEERRRRRPSIDLTILDSPEVIERILLNQKRRCAYCEEALEEGRVSATHYRPPSNAVFSDNGESDIQYYAWFAYEWENLLILCEECRLAKGESFPLEGGAIKPRASWADASSKEKPFLLDPYRASPSHHLMFSHNGEAIGRSNQGAVTIQVLGLNRQGLVDARAVVISRLKNVLLNSRPTWLARALADFSESTQFPGVVEIVLQDLCRVSDAQPRHTESLFGLNLFRKVAKVILGLDEAEILALVGRLDSRDLRFLIVKTDLDGLSLPRHPRKAYLSSLDIKGFKGLSDLSIEVTSGEGYAPCLMLLGENATGKSSVLQAIKIALSTAKERARLSKRWRELASPYPALEIGVRLQNGEETRVYTNREGKFVSKSKPECTVIGYGARRYFSSSRVQGGITYVNSTLFNPLATLRDPGGWLENLDEHKFDAVARALRSILTLSNDDSIIRGEHQDILIRVRDRQVPIEHLSDGYRSLFIMSIDIMRELLDSWDNLEVAEAIVLIDEIETHLHPRWKMRVMSALREAMPRVQFICTTHDPLCLRGMKKGEVVLLQKNEDYETEVHHDLPDISTLRIEQILSSDYFGLSSTEDPAQDYIVRRLAELAGLSEIRMTDSQRSERDLLLARYQGIPYIGSSQDRQILTEAITKHLSMNPGSGFADHSDARKKSVDTVIAVLKRAMER